MNRWGFLAPQVMIQPSPLSQWCIYTSLWHFWLRKWRIIVWLSVTGVALRGYNTFYFMEKFKSVCCTLHLIRTYTHHTSLKDWYRQVRIHCHRCLILNLMRVIWQKNNILTTFWQQGINNWCKRVKVKVFSLPFNQFNVSFPNKSIYY